VNDPHDAQALITRLEDLSRTDPGAYRFRVALVAMLGYAYLLGVVVGLLVFVHVAVYMMILLHQLNFLGHCLARIVRRAHAFVSVSQSSA
jgi:hypothetical protein